eukprot:5772778-Prymnesium_polylepis.1
MQHSTQSLAASRSATPPPTTRMPLVSATRGVAGAVMHGGQRVCSLSPPSRAGPALPGGFLGAHRTPSQLCGQVRPQRASSDSCGDGGVGVGAGMAS